ncbi:MAG: hypothetical protein JWN34_1566 [Bryobacterales bacterium]|nr:hypothetical protein [Bryobacterales bacterium]
MLCYCKAESGLTATVLSEPYAKPRVRNGRRCDISGTNHHSGDVLSGGLELLSADAHSPGTLATGKRQNVCASSRSIYSRRASKVRLSSIENRPRSQRPESRPFTAIRVSQAQHQIGRPSVRDPRDGYSFRRVRTHVRAGHNASRPRFLNAERISRSKRLSRYGCLFDGTPRGATGD